MAKQFQPLTLQITTSPRRLRSQLLAAWPTAPHATTRLRAIKTITRRIKVSLPADYNGDISVFVSNEASTIHEPITQGFLYHLTSQQIVNRQPLKKADNTALLHIHFTTAQSKDVEEEKLKTETVPVSRIQQIKQWQKETVKAMFQAMADTAISMESQTALRGTMAGLNKLGALLNIAVAAQKLPQSIARVRAQKTAQRDITNTLSDLRSNLSLASGNGLKPPTKSQLALRQQLNKLDRIAPLQQKPTVKTAPTVKSTPTIKSAPVAKSVKAPKATASASAKPIITQRFNIKTEPTRVARISIQPLRINTVAKTFVAPRTATPGIPIRVLPRRVITPARIVTGIMQRVSLPITTAPTHRYAATTTKTIIKKIAQRPTVPKSTTIQSRSVIQPTRTTPRFQISRPIIARLRVTPTIIAAYHKSLRTPNTVTEQKAKAEPAKQEKQAPHQSNPPKDTKTLVATTKLALQPNIIATQSLGSKIPLRTTRSPAVYAALSPMITPLRQATMTPLQSVVTGNPTTAYLLHSAQEAPPSPPTRFEGHAPTSVGVQTPVATPITVAIPDTGTPLSHISPAQPATQVHVEVPVARAEQIPNPDVEKPKSGEPVVTSKKGVEPPHIQVENKPVNKAGDIISTPSKANDGTSPLIRTPTDASPIAGKPHTDGKPPQPAIPSHTIPPLPPAPVNDGAPALPNVALHVPPTNLHAIPKNIPVDNHVAGQPVPTQPLPTPTLPPISLTPNETPKEVTTSNVVSFPQVRTSDPKERPIAFEQSGEKVTLKDDTIIDLRDRRLPRKSVQDAIDAWVKRDRTGEQTGTGGWNSFINTNHAPPKPDDKNPEKPITKMHFCICRGWILG